MTQGNAKNKDILTRIRHALSYFRVPLTALVVAALMTTFHDMKALWVGAGVALFGQLIQIWSCSHIYKQKYKNKMMAISGPYAHVRNPMYIGRFFVLMGPFLATGNQWVVLTYIVLFAIYAHFRVQREEKFLKKHFAPEYLSYHAEVPRWIPSLKRYSGASDRAASWEQVIANREHVNLTLVVLFIVAAYIRIQYFGDSFNLNIFGG